MQLGTSSTFRQLTECGEQVETKKGKWKRSVEVFLIRCSSGKCHLLASDGAVLGPDCCIASGKHIMPFHDIMEARGTKPVSCRSTSQAGETNGPRLISAPINSSVWRATGR